MPDLRWLPEAVADLDRLFRFLKEKNPPAARRAAGTIRKGADLLRSAPEIGRPMADGTGRRELVIPFASGGYVLRAIGSTMTGRWSSSASGTVVKIAGLADLRRLDRGFHALRKTAAA